MRGQVRGKRVVDLGCGTGRFCVAAAYLGAECICVELDVRNSYHLRTVQWNNKINIVQAQVPKVGLRGDLVVQNPPFGVKRKHADLEFLSLALKIAPAVYSIHKDSPGLRTRLKRLAQREGFSLEALEEAYPLRAQYPDHRRVMRQVNVLIVRMEKQMNENSR
jgi:Predicted RNA methylase